MASSNRKTPIMSCTNIDVGTILLGIDGFNYKVVLDIKNGRIFKSWKITTEDLTPIFEDEYDDYIKDDYGKYRTFIIEKLIDYKENNRELIHKEKMKKAALEYNLSKVKKKG